MGGECCWKRGVEEELRQKLFKSDECMLLSFVENRKSIIALKAAKKLHQRFMKLLWSGNFHQTFWIK
jgi:hypothetical protein